MVIKWGILSQKHATPADSELSCFEILNRYHNRLFISREKLLEHITIAQKDPKGQISWVEFDAPFHSHLIRVALALFDKPPLPIAKWALFVFILEALNCVTAEKIFTQKSGAEKPRHNSKESSPRYVPRKEEVVTPSSTTPKETRMASEKMLKQAAE